MTEECSDYYKRTEAHFIKLTLNTETQFIKTTIRDYNYENGLTIQQGVSIVWLLKCNSMND